MIKHPHFKINALSTFRGYFEVMSSFNIRKDNGNKRRPRIDKAQVKDELFHEFNKPNPSSTKAR